MKIFLFLLEVVYLFLAFKTEERIYFLIAIWLFIWWLIVHKKDVNRRNEEIKTNSIEMLEKIPHTRYTLSSDYLRALLINENTNSLYIATREDLESDFEEKEYPFNEIYEVAVLEDQKIVSIISRGGVHGWSLIDGGTGINAVVNIVESKDSEEESDEDSEDKVSKIYLKMVVDDLSNPIVEYVFMEDKHGISKESDEYKEIIKECNKWHQKISILIKRYGKEEVAVRGWI